MPGWILVNPSAGDDTLGVDAIREHFPNHEIEECSPEKLTSMLDRIDERDDLTFVGMSGGDGSMRTVAHRLRGTGLPLLVIPGGTRNHLARDLGISSVEAARLAAAEANTRDIDLGDANGETFVNTLSIGIYPELVRRRERHEQRFPKPIANLIAAIDQLWNGRRTHMVVGGVAHAAWAVFVGNGRYGSGLSNLTARQTLDDGVLDLRVVRADRRLGRLRVTFAVLFGRLEHSPMVQQLTTAQLTLESKHPTVRVALDGEVVVLESPIEVQCRPLALTVLAPAPSDHRSDR